MIRLTQESYKLYLCKFYADMAESLPLMNYNFSNYLVCKKNFRNIFKELDKHFFLFDYMLVP